MSVLVAPRTPASSTQDEDGVSSGSLLELGAWHTGGTLNGFFF